LLEELDRVPLVDSEVLSVQQEMAAEITAWWQSDEVRRAAPTVFDEIQMGLDYSAVLFETIPELYQEIAESVEQVYGAQADQISLPCLVEFGSWIGGDYDGNPNVTPEATRYALTRGRQTAITHYLQCVHELRRQLSPSQKRVDVSAELKSRMEEYDRTLDCQITDRPDEPYRRLSSCILHRLQLAMSEPNNSQAYDGPDEFARDLELIRSSLAGNKGARLARLLVDPLLRKLDAFGFHLFVLDIRQHAFVHAKAAAALNTAQSDTTPARELLGNLRDVARM